MIEPENVGERVVAWRTNRKMSRETFARHVGLTPGALWRIENKNSLKPGELDQLNSALNKEPEVPPITAPKTAARPLQHVTLVDPPEDISGLPKTGPVQAFALEFTQPTTAIQHQTIDLPELPGGTDTSPTVMSEHDGFRRVSNSEVQTFKRCRRKWYLAYFRSLQAIHQSATGPRAIGDRLHRALRFHYQPELASKIGVQDALEALIAADWTTLVNKCANDPRIEDGQVPLSVEAQFKKDADLERVIIEGYLEWLAETGSDSEYELVGAETYLEADLPTVPNVKIIARLDARVRRMADNVRLFIDHKSVGNFQQLTRGLHMNEQMLWYILIEALQSSETTPIVGALYNMMRRTKRGPTAKPPFYERIEVHHGSIEINSFLEKLTGVITDMIAAQDALNDGTHHLNVAYPTPTSDCSWSCDFFQVCGMMDDGSHVEGMIKAYFKVGDPLGYYVKGNSAD